MLWYVFVFYFEYKNIDSMRYSYQCFPFIAVFFSEHISVQCRNPFLRRYNSVVNAAFHFARDSCRFAFCVCVFGFVRGVLSEKHICNAE